ncbi:MAG: hypothetical protein PHQ53_01710 [Candidatus Krumholzibacteria bacterium]|nr:hypothetical protein [Candidatus Krumholzibacteria bacterium]
MPYQPLQSPSPQSSAYRRPDGTWRPPRQEGLARVLAKAGYGARPRTSAIICAGRITLAGQVVRDPGCAVGPDSVIHLDGEPLREAPRHFLALNKPTGFDCRTLRESERCIGGLLPPDLVGLEPAGRLDSRARGLLVLSNDLWWNSQVSENPDLPKCYDVLVAGSLTAMDLEEIGECLHRLSRRQNRIASFEVVAMLEQRSLVRLEVRGGHSRDIRGVFVAARHPVLRLVRTSLGPVDLQDLANGQHRRLTMTEIRSLIRLNLA